LTISEASLVSFHHWQSTPGLRRLILRRNEIGDSGAGELVNCPNDSQAFVGGVVGIVSASFSSRNA